MLTVKVISPGGGEEIHCGLSIGFEPTKQSIAVSGMDHNIMLKKGDIAYVMNVNGKIISRYENTIALFHTLKLGDPGSSVGENIWEVPSELGRPI